MIVRPVTHERLRGVVDRWRVEQGVHESMVKGDVTGQRRVLAKTLQQCANDLDLALRDDESIQPRRRK